MQNLVADCRPPSYICERDNTQINPAGPVWLKSAELAHGLKDLTLCDRFEIRVTLEDDAVTARGGGGGLNVGRSGHHQGGDHDRGEEFHGWSL